MRAEAQRPDLIAAGRSSLVSNEQKNSTGSVGPIRVLASFGTTAGTTALDDVSATDPEDAEGPVLTGPSLYRGDRI